MNQRCKKNIMVSAKKKEAVISNKDGFTLLEILAAISIMAIAMLAIASMQFTVVRNNLTGSQFTDAIEIARQQMEFLKNEDAINSPLLNPVETDPAVADPVPIAAAHEDNPINGTYTCTWTVNNYRFDASVPPDGVIDTVSAFGRTLTVTVSWIKQGPGGGLRTVNLQGLTLGSGM